MLKTSAAIDLSRGLKRLSKPWLLPRVRTGRNPLKPLEVETRTKIKRTTDGGGSLQKIPQRLLTKKRKQLRSGSNSKLLALPPKSYATRRSISSLLLSSTFLLSLFSHLLLLSSKRRAKFGEYFQCRFRILGHDFSEPIINWDLVFLSLRERRREEIHVYYLCRHCFDSERRRKRKKDDKCEFYSLWGPNEFLFLRGRGFSFFSSRYFLTRFPRIFFFDSILER